MSPNIWKITIRSAKYYKWFLEKLIMPFPLTLFIIHMCFHSKMNSINFDGDERQIVSHRETLFDLIEIIQQLRRRKKMNAYLLILVWIYGVGRLTLMIWLWWLLLILRLNVSWMNWFCSLNMRPVGGVWRFSLICTFITNWNTASKSNSATKGLCVRLLRQIAVVMKGRKRRMCRIQRPVSIKCFE